jgi:hypothetical protein
VYCTLSVFTSQAFIAWLVDWYNNLPELDMGKIIEELAPYQPVHRTESK